MEPDFDDLEARLLSLSPPVALPVPDDFEERLRGLEDASPDPEPEEEEVPQTGRIVISYNRAVIRRDETGRISEIVEATSRKFIERDLFGTPVAITEVVETEETEEPEEKE